MYTGEQCTKSKETKRDIYNGKNRHKERKKQQTKKQKEQKIKKEQK